MQSQRMSELTPAPWALVVDDEPDVRTLVSYALTSQGFKVSTASNAHEAWSILQEGSFDIVILDIVMPGASGTALCERIRRDTDIPVIMLSALNAPGQRVEGLEAGADDYVAKPFNPRELALRAIALHRRAHMTTEVDIINGALAINREQRRVVYHAEDIHISESEFRLCLTLTEHAGRPLSYDELASAVWGDANIVGAKEMLKTNVWRLRLRLSQVNPSPVIENVRGVGYRMLKIGGPVTV